jgi:regulatory protein YycH of two-component signal transduction system YycFG
MEMIKFKTKQYGDVEFDFQYNYPFDTAATLYRKDGEDYVILETAFVNRFHTDTWNKKVARKEAFKKLVEASPMDRDDRTSAWKAFHDNCKLV